MSKERRCKTRQSHWRGSNNAMARCHRGEGVTDVDSHQRRWKRRRNARARAEACSQTKPIDVEGDQELEKVHRTTRSLGRFRGDLLGRTDPRDRIPPGKPGQMWGQERSSPFPGEKGGSRDRCHVDTRSKGGRTRGTTARPAVARPMWVFTIQVAALHPTMQTVAGVAPGHAIRSVAIGRTWRMDGVQSTLPQKCLICP